MKHLFNVSNTFFYFWTLIYCISCISCHLVFKDLNFVVNQLLFFPPNKRFYEFYSHIPVVTCFVQFWFCRLHNDNLVLWIILTTKTKRDTILKHTHTHTLFRLCMSYVHDWHVLGDVTNWNQELTVSTDKKIFYKLEIFTFCLLRPVRYTSLRLQKKSFPGRQLIKWSDRSSGNWFISLNVGYCSFDRN